jgi:hypothetical protein
VIAVLTAKDVANDGLRPLRPTVEANVQTNEPFRFLPQPMLAEVADTIKAAPHVATIAVNNHCTRNHSIG